MVFETTKTLDGFLNPQEVLDKLELRANMVAVDFGSGSGGWVIPLAKKLKEGKVYAIDVLEESLSALKSKVAKERNLNIEIIRANVEDKIPLPDEFCDLVLMTNLLFQVEDKKQVFLEAKRILKKSGKILVVDWLSKATLGPVEGRVSEEEVKKIAQNLNFNLEREFKSGAYHYGLIFVKS